MLWLLPQLTDAAFSHFECAHILLQYNLMLWNAILCSVMQTTYYRDVTEQLGATHCTGEWQSRDRCKVTLHCNTYCSALYCTEMQNVDRCTVKMHCDALKSGQVQPWSGRQRHRLGARDRPNSTNWRLPQIRLTPNRQILLSGFRQILNNWEANTLLPIDPLCPANIHLWPPHKYSQLTNIWEGLMKSRNVKPENHERLIRGVFGFVRLFCW